MAVPICAASPAGWYGMPSHSLTDAGQLIQRDAADGLSFIVMVSLSVVGIYFLLMLVAEKHIDAGAYLLRN